jgi:hypothetical protein
MRADFDYEEDEPPACLEAKGHPPARRGLINFVVLRRSVQDSIAADMESLHKLDRIIAEPTQDERTLGEIVNSESSRLLEFIGFFPKGTCEEKESVARDVVEKRLAVNRRAAENAKAARPQVEQRIALKESQLEQLNKRENSFLLPAISEMLESSSLGHEYMRCINNVREIMQVIFAAGEMLRGNGVSPGKWDKIERPIQVRQSHDHWNYDTVQIPEIVLPKAGMASLKLVPDERVKIKLADKNPWREIADKLLASPAEPVALPKLAA